MITSTITTIVASLFGTPLAYMLARWKVKYKSGLEVILDLPIVLPPSVAGLALLIAFGRRGLFGPALSVFGISLPFTTVAVVMAQMFVAAPLYVRSARIGFTQVDELTQVAKGLLRAKAKVYQPQGEGRDIDYYGLPISTIRKRAGVEVVQTETVTATLRRKRWQGKNTYELVSYQVE